MKFIFDILQVSIVNDYKDVEWNSLKLIKSYLPLTFKVTDPSNIHIAFDVTVYLCI